MPMDTVAIGTSAARIGMPMSVVSERLISSPVPFEKVGDLQEQHLPLIGLEPASMAPRRLCAPRPTASSMSLAGRRAAPWQ